MTHQELELWSQDIISDVLKGQRIEDSKIELKSSWPDPDRAAHSLAAHANAARGTAIVWLIGVDEKAQRLTNANPVEAYISMKRANHLVTAALAVPSQHQQPAQLDGAWKAVRACRELIETARAGIMQL